MRALISSRKPCPRSRGVLLALLLLLGGLAPTAMPAAAAAASGVVRTSWEPTVDAFWAVNRTTILDAMQNGQCTQWAADRRPDIVRRVIRALVARELAAHQSEYWGDWTARDWVGLASTAHIPHGAMPRAGAIAVFQPGVDNAEAGTGHVAYVERVNADGSVRISEMAAPTLGKISYRTLTRAQARAAGLAYIYR